MPTPAEKYVSSPATLPFNGSEIVHISQGGVSKGAYLNGGVAVPTTNYSIATGVSTVLLNAASGTITVPSGLPVGTRLNIEKISASAGTMTIARSGSETFQGSTSVTITQQYGRCELVKISSTTWTYCIYETGTFTPGISFGGGTTGITYSTQIGKYTRRENLVTFSLSLVLTSKGTSTGTALVTGLPLSSVGAYNIPISIGFRQNITANDTILGYIVAGSTTISMNEATTAGVQTVLTDADFANNSVLIVSGTYFLT